MIGCHQSPSAAQEHEGLELAAFYDPAPGLRRRRSVGAEGLLEAMKISATAQVRSPAHVVGGPSIVRRQATTPCPNVFALSHNADQPALTANLLACVRPL